MLFERTNVRVVRFDLGRSVGGSGVSVVDVLIAEVVDSDGVTGLGFSYVIGGGAASALTAAKEQADRFICGQTPLHPQAHWRKIFGSFNRTGLGPNLIGLAAIDVALWDHHAKRRNVSLAVAMGGEPRAVEVYGSGGFAATQSPKEAADSAADQMARGFRTIKPRVKGAESDAALLTAVRQCVGSDIQIAVDANEKCDLPAARRLLSLARDHGILFVEEPLPATAFEAYRALAKMPVAIAAGEHLQQRADFVSLMRCGALSVIQPDLAMAGGLSPILELATIAGGLDVTMSPHFLPGLFVHVAAAAPSIRLLEEFPLLEPIFEGWPERNPQSSTMRPSDVAGHGLVLSSRYAE